jgi:tape measure domain-containing protein
MAGSNDIEITAKFLADVSDLEKGTEEAAQSVKDMEESTSELGSSLGSIEEESKNAASGLGNIGDAAGGASKSLGDIDSAGKDAAKNLDEIGSASKEASGNLGDIGGVGKSATDGLQGVGMAGGEASKGLGQVGSSGGEASKGLQDVENAGNSVAKELESVGSAGGEASKGLGAVGSSGEEATKGMQELGSAGGQAESGISEVGTASEEATEKTEKTGNTAKGTGESFNSMAMGAMQAAQQIAQFAQLAGQAIGAIGAIKAAADSTVTAFDHLTQDTQKTDEMLSQLSQTAASEDFGKQNIDNVAQHMLMLGMDSKTIIPEISKVSDAIAGMGGGAKNLEPVIDKLETIRTSSKVTASDMDALVAQDFPAWQALAQGMGVSVAQAQKEVMSGAVSGSKAMDDMMKGLDQYGGDANAQAKELGPEWARFVDNLGKGFTPLADDIASILDGINNMSDETQSFTDDLKDAYQAAQHVADIFAQILTFGLSNKVGGVNSFNPAPTPSSAVGSLPGHASGGTNLSGLSVIGENGPELFDPNGGSIYPFDASGGANSALMSGGGGSSGPVTIQFIVDSKLMAQQILPQIAPMIRLYAGKRQ